MKHLYIGNEWVNALLRAFDNEGIPAKSLSHDLANVKDHKLAQGQRLPVTTVRQIWHQAAALANDPLLGVKIGQKLDYRALGALMPMLWHSPTVREALNNILRFQTLASESGLFKLTQAKTSTKAFVDLDVIYFSYIPTANVLPINPHQILSVVIGTIDLITRLSNHKVYPLKLTVPSTLNAKIIARSVNFPVQCAEGNVTAVFSTAHLDDAVMGCDPHLYEINKAYAQQRLRLSNEGLALIERVKTFIIQSEYGAAKFEAAEPELGISKRTLQRHLSDQGTSFRLLKEEVIKEQAVKLLIADRLPIEDIAKKLGYSEPSAFHRAFRNWFGVTPKQFGQSHR